jgi:large subunit ribosomal protein L24
MVQVVQGNDAGKRGRVLRTIPDSGSVVVENVNMVYRHMKRSQQHPQGGRIRKEAPIDASSVMIVCDSTNEPSRIRFEKDESGRKIRVFVKDGKPVPESGSGKSKKKK